ncbi:PLDc N-terminal domain-containing protein [Streptococcus hongkongensis]|nr:hypothetical protein NC01_08690 [Streptococcus uberis]
MNTTIPENLIPFLVPLFILQGILIIIALIKLRRLKKTSYLNKPVWVLIICFVNLFGPIAFLILEGKNQ